MRILILIYKYQSSDKKGRNALNPRFQAKVLVYSSVAGKFHVGMSADNGNVNKVFFSWTSNCLVFIMVDVLETLL